MTKTQHCPNCEATEQELSDFRQEVSNAVGNYLHLPKEVRAQPEKQENK